MATPLVLVVDDDSLLRIDTAEILEDAGFEVLQAPDAASALTVLKEKSGIQLVCTDVHMPGELDGIDLALRIREHFPHIKVIIVSALAKLQGRLSGAPFLVKPFAPMRLVDVAREQLGVV